MGKRKPKRKALTVRQRKALERRLAGEPTKTTAKNFGVGPGAIRMRRSRAYRRLSAIQLADYKRACGPGKRWRPMQISLLRQV